MSVRFLVQIAACLAIVGIASQFSLGELFSRCRWSNFTHATNPDVHGSAMVSYFYRRLLAEVVPQFLWVFSILEKLMAKKFWEAILLSLYFGLWFPGIMIVHYLKRSSSDIECSAKGGNGISGHFFYFAWALATLLLQHERLSLSRFRIAFGLSYFLVIFSLQGYFTLLYGYHSFRQCLLGAVCGLLWAAASWELVRIIQQKMEEKHN